MLIDDLTKLPDFYKEGYRGIMLLHRSKDGADGNPQRTSIKRISSNPTDFDILVKELNELRLQRYPEHRIYSSVNSRDMDACIREFKRRQLDADYDESHMSNRFYLDIENRFFSCFMNPKCKATSHFLFDCDSKAEYEETKKELHRCSHLIPTLEYETRNGWHIITPPFNPKGYLFPVEIKKDDLISIA
ncbi:hypothetical protein UFOVP816_14 [uncultured Caudovirales phage]|uniref:Uncharacterized protein n=1 Tax=uncultured Caudovirales phage TaxID=2100421 RepID=A0A6J5NZM3_9CAUD|nr:hypothetical protein UFOVP816_14 [uncultured Caudovirales phage]